MFIENPNGNGYMHICGKTTDEDCPLSFEGRCPECRGVLEPSYGFAGGYGLGTYNYCDKCNKFLDFCPDDGE